MNPMRWTRVAALVAVSLAVGGCALGVGEPDDGFDNQNWRTGHTEQRMTPGGERAGNRSHPGGMSPDQMFRASSDPNKPTPDPWMGLPPNKPTPDPWVDPDESGMENSGSGSDPTDRGGN